MPSTIYFTPVNRAVDADGHPVPAARAFFFDAGTTDQRTVYADPQLSVVLAQPVEADAAGVFPQIYAQGSAGLRVLVSDAEGAPLPGFPLDDVSNNSSGGTAAATSFSPTEALPFLNVQAAVEGAAAIAESQTEVAERALTAWGTGGEDNDYTITPDPAITSYGSWQWFTLLIDRDNDGAATLEVNGLGKRDMQKYDTDGTPIALDEGDLREGQVVQVQYDGTRFVLMSTITDEGNVAITGGTINGTPIGGVTPAAGAFTTLTATGASSIGPITIAPLADAYPTSGQPAIYRATVGSPGEANTGALVLMADPDNTAQVVFVTGEAGAPAMAGRFNADLSLQVVGGISVGGDASVVGDVTAGGSIESAAGLVAGGHVRSEPGVFRGEGGGDATLATGTGDSQTGEIRLRPRGTGTTTNQTVVANNGNMTVSGNVTASSDERLKEDWQPLACDFLDAMRLVKAGSYRRKDSGERQVGVSAQDLRRALPEAVVEGKDGMLSVDYGRAALMLALALLDRL